MLSRLWRAIRRAYEWAEHTYFGGMLLDRIFDWRRLLMSTALSFGVAAAARWITNLSWPEVIVLVMGTFAFTLSIVVCIVWLYGSFHDHRQRPYPDFPLKEYVKSVLGTASLSVTPGQADRLLDLLAKISEEAASSKFTVWGRKAIGGDAFSMVGVRNNLKPISPTYWSDHVIDEIHFLKNQSGRTRTTLFDTSNSYEDLHLSWAQLKSSEYIRIPLQTAAAELYGEIAKTKLGKTTADYCASEQEIWDAMGTLLVNRGEVWGRRPGTTDVISLYPVDKRYSAVVGGAKMLRDRSAEKKTSFTDLSITRNELNRIKEYVKARADAWEAS